MLWVEKMIRIYRLQYNDDASWKKTGMSEKNIIYNDDVSWKNGLHTKSIIYNVDVYWTKT